MWKSSMKSHENVHRKNGKRRKSRNMVKELIRAGEFVSNDGGVNVVRSDDSDEFGERKSMEVQENLVVRETSR